MIKKTFGSYPENPYVCIVIVFHSLFRNNAMSLTKHQFDEELSNIAQPTEMELAQMYHYEAEQRRKWYMDTLIQTAKNLPDDHFFTSGFETYMETVKSSERLINSLNEEKNRRMLIESRKDESHINTPIDTFSFNHANATGQKPVSDPIAEELKQLSDDLDKISEELRELDNLFKKEDQQ